MAWQISYIEPVLFIYTITLYLNIPMENQMIYRKVCLNHYNKTFCKIINTPNHTAEENVVQAETAQWNMYSNIARIVPTVVSTIYLGAWSDGFGRKKVLMVAVLGETLNAIGFFMNAWYFSAPIPFIFIGSIVTGLCGNFAAILMSVLAYVGDVTTEYTRTIRITILDALIFLASIISLFTGGVMLEKLGFLYVYALDIVLYILIIVYMFFLKESYYPTEEIKIRDVFCGNKLMDYVRLFTQERVNYYRVKVIVLLGCFCTLFFATTGIDQVLILYLLHTPLHFTPSSIGYVLASESGIKFVSAVIVTTVFIKKLKWHDSSLILICSIAVTGYSLCLAFSRINLEIYLSTLWGIGMYNYYIYTHTGINMLVHTHGHVHTLIFTHDHEHGCKHIHMHTYQEIPWISPGYPLEIPWISPGDSLDMPWRCPGDALEMP